MDLLYRSVEAVVDQAREGSWGIRIASSHQSGLRRSIIARRCMIRMVS